MSGWLPVFDTMHGIRGEVNIILKVELFSDLNKFRQSSCGVQFFCCLEVPEGYKVVLYPVYKTISEGYKVVSTLSQDCFT